MKQRPNPDKLLKRANEEESQQQRAKLKIYLGASPGVGKTYTMLQDAAALRKQGLDVIVGVVESHGRAEIESLIKEFDVLPRQIVEYRGHELKEFDLDAALKRNPALILMDELAHTNAPGLLHAKRWQDVKELLDRGIDVYTTLNVQHIESLVDVVSQIIHTRVKETVPDAIIEMADTIELVDLPPEDLLKRLREGKVYFPAQAELAEERFFRKGNLIALRELALRELAGRVGEQVLLYRQGEGIKHVWPTNEKIMVCVGHRTQSTKLIRTAKRMATTLQAEWTAVHVDKPQLKLTEEQNKNVLLNLHLAEQLGAETRILNGFDAVKEIMNYAHDNNITLIMVCKHVRSRFREFLLRGLADEIIRHSGEIDVYVLTDYPEALPVQQEKKTEKEGISWSAYLFSIGVVGLVTAINTLLFPYLNSNVIMLYLLGVTVVSMMGQKWPSILATLLSVLAYDIFFVPPFYKFGPANLEDFTTLLVLLIVSQVISQLTLLVRRQAESSLLLEHQTATMHKFSRRLATTRGVDKLLESGVNFIGNLFDCDVMALLPEHPSLQIRALFGSDTVLNEKEMGLAQWVFDLGQMAGMGTDTLPYSEAIYLPLSTSHGTIGVLRVRPRNVELVLVPEKMKLLEACTDQLALALDVDSMQEQSRVTELAFETDRARSALLQSVSHDLRTPLVAVMGAASTLMEISDRLDKATIKNLGKEIYVETEQLSRLINNLLQITYLENDVIRLQLQQYSLPDVINFVVKMSAKKLENRKVNEQIPRDVPKIYVDHTLIQEVLLNLIDNAVKFTTPGTPIDIKVEVKDYNIMVSVEDHGPGIVADEVNKLFEKFYRGRQLGAGRGLGLGLAICKRIVEAHGGKIWAENRDGGGAAFRFTLPLRRSEK